jgi:hypothetical protein
MPLFVEEIQIKEILIIYQMSKESLFLYIYEYNGCIYMVVTVSLVSQI